MLEIIRAYGRERLAEAGETEIVRQRHGSYFLRLAELGREPLLGDGQLEWLPRLTAEQDNLHSAVRAAVAARDPATAAGLIGASGLFWWLRNKEQGGELAVEALGLVDELTDGERSEIFDREATQEPLALAYAMGGLLTFDSPRPEAAVRWLLTAHSLMARIVDRTGGDCNPLFLLAEPLARLISGEAATSPRGFDEAVASPHRWVSAISRILRGQVELNVGAVEAAEADFQAAADEFGGLGERWGLAVALTNLASLAVWRGEYTAAAAYHHRAIVLVAELGSLEDEIQARLNLARDLWLAGGEADRERSRAELAAALRGADELGWPEVSANAAYTAGNLARLAGDLDAARMYLNRADDIARRPGLPGQLVALVASSLGYLAAETGDLVAARGCHQRAIDTAVRTHDGPAIAQVLVGLADLARREGDPVRAATLLGASEGVRGTRDRSISDEFRVAEAVRGALTPADWDDAFQRGRGVTLATLDAVLTPGGGTRGPRAARTPR